jgi:hypothetical protein
MKDNGFLYMNSRFGKCKDFLELASQITGKSPIITIPEAAPIGPNSMIAHVDLLCETIDIALCNKQLQPVIMSPYEMVTISKNELSANETKKGVLTYVWYRWIFPR